jgi:Tol biopolymer transport system component
VGAIDVVTSTINVPTPLVSYLITIDGARLTTVGSDTAVRLTDVAVGRRAVRLEGIPQSCRVGQETQAADVSAGGVANVAFIVICPGTTQNGDRILFSGFTTDWNLWTMAPDGSDLRVMPGMTPAVEQEAVWSPDGSRIAFNSNREPGTIHTFVMNADGSSVRRISESTFEKSGVSWTPDGTYVVFGGVTAGTLGFDLCLASADSQQVTRIAVTTLAEDEYPSVSPDGSEIAYASGPSRTDQDIFGMSADGSRTRLVYNATGTARYPRWSPDGRKLLFEANRAAGEPRDVFLINSVGTGLINLTNGFGDNREPAWSPDGTLIVFGSDREKTQDFDFNIYVMDADGRNPKKLTSMASRERLPDWRRK